MTGPQYKAALARLGLSQAGAAEFLDISLRASHGYANGAAVPLAVAKLLRLMVRLDLSPKDVK